MENNTGTTSDKKLKVCIIEDEEMISEMYQAKLEEQNYQVDVASNGEKGFKLIKRIKPDIILTDIMMPEKDGIDLARDIRKSPEISRTPIIFLTNVDDSETVEKTYDLDIDFYLVKSQYQPSDVARIIKEVLDSKHIST